MAIFPRIHGDSEGVVNVDSGSLVSLGIGKHPTAFKVTLAAAGSTAVGGNVESAIRALCIGGTVLAYQVDGTQLSVLMESHGFADDAAALAALGALASAVTSAGGMKFA